MRVRVRARECGLGLGLGLGLGKSSQLGLDDEGRLFGLQGYRVTGLWRLRELNRSHS